jgi:hypothetical protein
MNTDIFYKEKERKKNLFFDKRVKHIVNCDLCKSPISKNKSQKNSGYCDLCIDALY